MSKFGKAGFTQAKAVRTGTPAAGSCGRQVEGRGVGLNSKYNVGKWEWEPRSRVAVIGCQG